MPSRSYFTWLTPARRLALLLTCGVLAAPVIVTELLRFNHSQGYQGICGPYATDIPAHACTYPQYMANFTGGFSGLALMLIQLVVLSAATGLGLILWSILKRRIKESRS